MGLQNAYYIIGIIFMILYGILLIAVVVILAYIWKKITDIQRKVEQRLEEVKEIFHHPKETAAEIGAGAASSALHQVAEILRPKNKKKQ